ncbi:MAG TPA: hypothetical protein VNY73_07015 [Bacteroidia bacterium]|jgi:hypothetical protein|nr:hypothetical protein [Bacteroidia bacterium]
MSSKANPYVIVRISDRYYIIEGKFKGNGAELIVLTNDKEHISTNYYAIPDFLKTTETQRDHPGIKYIRKRLRNHANSRCVPVIYTDMQKSETIFALAPLFFRNS